jgi:hypothetical protein
VGDLGEVPSVLFSEVCSNYSGVLLGMLYVRGNIDPHISREVHGV